MAKWLPTLEKTLEKYSVGSNEAYRVYMSAEPAPTPESHNIPQVTNATAIWGNINMELKQQQNEHHIPYDPFIVGHFGVFGEDY